MGTCGQAGARPVPNCIPATDYGPEVTDLTGAQLTAWDQTQTFFDGPHTYGSITSDGFGNARLTTTGQANNDAQLSSSNLAETTGLLYKYGIFEAELYLPGCSGNICNWPAFWLSSSDATWPAGGEFDVMEGLGGLQRVDYHYPGCGGVCTIAGSNLSVSVPGWHDFTAVWEQDYAAVYMDGAHIFDYYSPNVQGTVPLEVVFDMAAGWAGYSTWQPSTLVVGWFRAYQWSGK